MVFIYSCIEKFYLHSILVLTPIDALINKAIFTNKSRIIYLTTFRMLIWAPHKIQKELYTIDVTIEHLIDQEF